jgi:hypothetical protein
MIDDPNDWLKKPATLAGLMRFWAMPEKTKRARGFYPPKFGPERAQMLSKLNLAA